MSKVRDRATIALGVATSLLLFGVGTFILSLGCIAAYQSNASLAGVLLSIGFVFLLGASVDRFESLKGLGVEVKTLRQKLNDADESLERIRSLAEAMLKPIVRLNSEAGRWSSAPSATDSLALAQTIKGTLEGLGSKEEMIAEVLEPWARSTCFDLTRAVAMPLEDALEDQAQRWDMVRNSIAQPIADPDEFARIHTAATIPRHYVNERLRTLHLFTLEDYREGFMAIFDDAPLENSSLKKTLRDRAMTFQPLIASMVDEQKMREPKKWLDEIDALKARER